MIRVDNTAKQKFGGACAVFDRHINQDVTSDRETLPECPEPNFSERTETKKLERKDRYRIEDFTRFHDLDFIVNAYQLILQRGPDESGKNYYLEQLRKGYIGKKELLGRLRYSDEGRRAGVEIEGLLLPFLLSLMAKVPILGRLVKIMMGIVSLPNLRRNLQVVENELYYQNDLIIKELQQTQRELLRLQEHVKSADNCLLGFVRKRIKVHEFQKLRSQITVLAEKIIPGTGNNGELDELYLAFEDRFRGESGSVKEKLEVNLENVEKTLESSGGGEILDLGCGRGEWLEILQNRGLDVVGVDSNPAMVRLCQQKKLPCVEGDIFQFLESYPDSSCSLITSFHVIEHLSAAQLIKLMREIHRVLRKGGGVLFETPNPENLAVGSCRFYYDITHRNPLPPATVDFLLEYCGFGERQLQRLNPDLSLQKSDPGAHKFFSVGQDYSIWGWKN